MPAACHCGPRRWRLLCHNTARFWGHRRCASAPDYEHLPCIRLIAACQPTSDFTQLARKLLGHVVCQASGCHMWVTASILVGSSG